MPVSSIHDPRSALVAQKYFSLYPQPLERWLWQQGLPQAAERVFWIHWQRGMQTDDWCSEIPIKVVARECSVDTSTVTRAYQILKTKGLIRREDPGRDPKNPFCQATAITEVRLPREFLCELSRSPNRPPKALPRAAEGTPDRLPEAIAISAPVPAPVTCQPAGSVAGPSHHPSREKMRALWGRASAGESAKFYAASRDRLTGMEFDADTRLTPEDRGYLLAQLAQLAIARPAATPPKATATPKAAGPRRLSVLDLARTRRLVLEAVPAPEHEEVLRQVIWSVEEGALRRFDSPLALNIALKKIRQGAWSKPNRMPPNWYPRATRASASPEQCSAA
jgi:hypothetical protein